MAESPTITKPTRRRMTLQALRIVEAAERDAHDQPITMTPAIRLALGWLLFDRVAEYWQALEFMRSLTRPADAGNGMQADYCRQRDLTIYVEAWRREVRRRDSKWRDSTGG